MLCALWDFFLEKKWITIHLNLFSIFYLIYIFIKNIMFARHNPPWLYVMCYKILFPSILKLTIQTVHFSLSFYQWILNSKKIWHKKIFRFNGFWENFNIKKYDSENNLNFKAPKLQLTREPISESVLIEKKNESVIEPINLYYYHWRRLY